MKPRCFRRNGSRSTRKGIIMAFKLSKRSLARLEGVDERMVRVVKTAIGITKLTLALYVD